MPVATWEELIGLANPNLRVLVEVNPAQEYKPGADWTSVGSNTYSHACNEVSVNAVTDNGVELTAKATVGEVQSNAGSYFFDLFNHKIYVHCTDNDVLTNSGLTITIMVFVWKLFSTHACEMNGMAYAPLVRKDSLPNMDLSVDDIVEGSYKFNFGSVTLNNDGRFDKDSDVYVWVNRRILIKLGGEGMNYADYVTYFVGRIADYFVADEEIIFSVKDIRENTFAQIPINHYWKSNLPNLPDENEGKAIPIFFGIKTNIPATLIDTSNRYYQISDRPIKEVTTVYTNGTAQQGPGGGWFWDYLDSDRNIIKINPYIGPDVIVTVDAQGTTAEGTGGGTLVTNASKIAKDILKTYLGFLDDELDLTSFTEAETKRTYEICMYIDQDTASREVLQTLGRSIVAFFTPTDQGKLAFKIYDPETPVGTLEVDDKDFGEDWKVRKDNTYIRNRVKVGYDRDPQNQTFKYVEKSDSAIIYKYGVREVLELETFLRQKTDAEDIATGLLAMTSFPITSVETSFGIKGFKLYPTDKLKVTRARAGDVSGAFSSKVFRVKQVSKDIGQRQTGLVALDDLQTLGSIFCEVCYSCQDCFTAEGSCVDCVTCDDCFTAQGGCVVCDSCQHCFASEGGCQVCFAWQQCTTCQNNYGMCATCQDCDTCDNCFTCQAGEHCTTCQVCATCDTCHTCDGYYTCGDCQDCVSCDSCYSSCQLQYHTECSGCDNCNTCQSTYSPCQGCYMCYTCTSCETCQSWNPWCETCEHCYTCVGVYACGSCDNCYSCFSQEHCHSCDNCNTVQGSCFVCVNCEFE